jgi:hypothetical protein
VYVTSVTFASFCLMPSTTAIPEEEQWRWEFSLYNL